MGELFERYFQLLAGRCPSAAYGVIASPLEMEDTTPQVEPSSWECLCPGT